MKLISKKNKIAQMKIQEMAFVLIALFLLFSMTFIFYLKIKSSDIEKTSYELRQNKALSILDKIAAMPELGCSSDIDKGSLCLDEDKLLAMQGFQEEYKVLFKGLKELKVKKIYPSSEEYVLYSSGNNDYESYSAFISLCKRKYDNTAWYQCSIGLVSVSINV